MAQRLILIHGRSTKPRRAVKEQAARTALIHGLKRVNAAAAAKIESGAVPLDFAYYGDLSNEALIKANPELAQTMGRRPGEATWFEPDNCYDEPMRHLFARADDRFGKSDYNKLNE